MLLQPLVTSMSCPRTPRREWRVGQFDSWRKTQTRSRPPFSCLPISLTLLLTDFKGNPEAMEFRDGRVDTGWQIRDGDGMDADSALDSGLTT